MLKPVLVRVFLAIIRQYMPCLYQLPAARRTRDLVWPCEIGRKPVRVYLDGCFDVMHYGHANALRQARMLGDELVVGLISDVEIRAAKGPPVMNYAERKTLVGSVKWVNEVIDGEAPLAKSTISQACASTLDNTWSRCS